jgi:hypothetical protein
MVILKINLTRVNFSKCNSQIFFANFNYVLNVKNPLIDSIPNLFFAISLLLTVQSLGILISTNFYFSVQTTDQMLTKF